MIRLVRFQRLNRMDSLRHIVAFAFVVGGIACAQEPPSKPGALLLAEAARLRITGNLTVRTYSTGSHANIYRSTISKNGDIAFFSDGRSDSVTGVLEDGRLEYRREEAMLLKDGVLWHKLQRSETGDAYVGSAIPSQRGGLLDFRSIGLTGDFRSLLSPPDSWHGFAADSRLHYTETVNDDGLPVVLISDPQIDRSLRLVFDPQMDWNVIRADEVLNGQPIRTAETSYELANRVWVPVRTTFMDSEGRVSAVTEIEYRGVDSDERARELSPADIGFRPGAPVAMRDGTGFRHLYWTGKNAVASAEYDRLVREGDLSPDPLVRTWVNENRYTPELLERKLKERFIPPPDARKPDTAELTRILNERIRRTELAQADFWDRYVLEFIREHDLDADQSQKCHSILNDCKQRRQQYLASRANRFESLRHDRQPSEGDLKIAIEQLAQLQKPIDAIFTELTRRLSKIPTRAQLNHAATRADRQPRILQVPPLSSPPAER